MVTEASADLDMNQRSKLERLVCTYANVFADPDGQLGCTDRIRHTIDTREIALPLDLMVGKPPVEGRDPPSCPIEYVEWVRQASELAFEFARENLQTSAVRQKRLYDQRSDIRNHRVGDWVWRWYPPHAKQKLGKGWTGPYLVTQKVSDITYKVQRDKDSSPINVHVDHLKKFESEQYPESWLELERGPMVDQDPDIEVPIEFEPNNNELDNGDHTEVPTPKPMPRRSKRVIKPPNRLDL